MNGATSQPAGEISSSTRSGAAAIEVARPQPTAGRWLLAAAGSLLGFLLLLVAVLVTGGVDSVDTALMRWTATVRVPAVTLVAHLVTTLGSVAVVVAVAVLAATLLWRRTRSLVAPTVLLTSVVVTGAVVYLCKVAVGRTRPSTDGLLGTPSLDYSFPSGHTTNGAVVYLLTALLLAATLRSAARRRLLVAGAVLVAVAVGLSRVYLGYHWGSDVLAGWFLAAAVVLTGAFLTRLLASPTGPALIQRPGSLTVDATADSSDVSALAAPRRRSSLS